MTVVVGRIGGRTRVEAVEWPSLALCAGLYGSIAALTFFHEALPLPLLIVGGAVLLAWYSSLQHEFIHGHPTPWRRLNRALASAPLSIWLPFESYRRSHLIHHCDDHLTDPLDDPESYYWTAEAWAALGPAGRAVMRVYSTLAGRLLIGPAWNIGRYLAGQARAVLAGDRLRRRIWAWHALHVAVLLVWLVGVCHISLLAYAAMVYASTSLLLLRSFAEHRANEGVFERTAIVENSWLLGVLYLFNNLHAAHHERPLMPWYCLPAWYAMNRDRLVRENGGLVYDGYGAVVRAYLFKPHHVTVHPLKGDPQG